MTMDLMVSLSCLHNSGSTGISMLGLGKLMILAQWAFPDMKVDSVGGSTSLLTHLEVISEDDSDGWSLDQTCYSIIQKSPLATIVDHSHWSWEELYFEITQEEKLKQHFLDNKFRQMPSCIVALTAYKISTFFPSTWVRQLLQKSASTVSMSILYFFGLHSLELRCLGVLDLAPIGRHLSAQ